MPLEDLDLESWNQNRKMVLTRLDQIAAQVERIDSKIGTDLVNMRIEVAMLKTKFGIYAALIGGGSAAVIAPIMAFIVSRLLK